MRALSHLLATGLFFTIGLTSSLLGKDKTTAFKLNKTVGGQKIELTIVEVPFKKEGRKIETRDQNYVTKIDGRNVIGTDGMVPYKEISSFTLKWNGKAVPVPEKLWKDCYNLGAGSYKEPEFPEPGEDPQVKVTDDGEYLIVRFDGSDGAAYYQIVWVLAKNGKHARWTQ